MKDDQLTWYRTDPGIRFFRVILVCVAMFGVIAVISLILFGSYEAWYYAFTSILVAVVAMVLIIHNLFYFRRNWCTGVAITSQFVILKIRNNVIRRIPWANVNRIKLITAGSRLRGTVWAQIWYSNKKFDDATISGDAAMKLYKTWNEERKKLAKDVERNVKKSN